ncbi:nucleotidyltransferase [Metaplanococcus flavidus]|uniref:tRNA(Met) cytidine acetate ligase n=1 Tax=Metaplanococcus flavidus TaxID=569883 RepID=A0ABW3LCF7_9BACL
MKAAGIVVEYNPFHNGHLHHARSAKESSGADILIAVMSGQFLQRGEPAFADKWKRTEMALASGVDLVIELPYVYATAQASDFARGAITLLDAIGCESFCFGSEQGNIDPFLKSRQLLNSKNLLYQQEIHDAIQSGISYPKALNKAYQTVTDGEEGVADLSKPNNILGYHYIEAADRISSSMRPLTIQRIGANYHEPITEGMSIASATGIRNAFFEGGSIKELAKYLPAPSLQALQSFAGEYGHFGSWETFYPMLRYTILKDRPANLRRFAEVTEGIENLIYEAARKEQDFESFLALVKSKRFTRTRIQRMLTHIYTGFTWEQLKSFNQPSYLRLLGMTKAGRHYLHAQKKNITLPMISRAADLTDDLGKLDIHASSLYMLGMGAGNLKKEFTTPPIYFG